MAARVCAGGGRGRRAGQDGQRRVGEGGGAEEDGGADDGQRVVSRIVDDDEAGRAWGAEGEPIAVECVVC